jgi:hypothetical protein
VLCSVVFLDSVLRVLVAGLVEKLFTQFGVPYVHCPSWFAGFEHPLESHAPFLGRSSPLFCTF